jgi:lipopolysaccharide assembly outer membrane protein LptD (OstA)
MLKFSSNQVRSAVARENVKVEQFPFPNAEGRSAGKKLACQFLALTLSARGQLERVLAEKKVTAEQNEWSPKTPKPVQSRLAAESVTADFFPQTNQVRQITAERNVVIVQENRRAQGERAVYNATNNVLELTGHPTAELPEGKITEADVLIWDRAQNKLSGRRIRAEGTAPVPRSDLPPAK